MSTTNTFAYNTGATISGTTQVGDLSVGYPTSGYTGSPQYWNGPDQDLGYVIAKPVSGNTQPTPVFGVTASVGFWGTKNMTNPLSDASFIQLSEYVANKAGSPQTFATATDASNWLTSNGFWNSYGNLASFTISPSDFTEGGPIYQNTFGVGTNGVDGFVNTAAQGNFLEGYYGAGLTAGAISTISAAVTAAGLDPNNNTGYIWSVTWGAGSSISTGYVKFGYYAPGAYFDMQTVDPADTDWQLPGYNNGTSLAGTFLFPATFTQYLPLTNKGGWC
jgi:hypothetical protein